MMQLAVRLSSSIVPQSIGLGLQTLRRPPARLVPQLSRYSAVSVVALAADFSFYIFLVSIAVKASLAGVVGYALGMLVHYGLSSRLVFDTQRSKKPERRRFAEFLLSGFVGSALTGVVIALATQFLAAPPIAAKCLATVISFGVVFAIRRALVFAG
jgi:putative flippase GtrA